MRTAGFKPTGYTTRMRTRRAHTLLTMVTIIPWLGACSGMSDKLAGIGVRSVGLVVEDSLARGASEKRGVSGISDTGQALFSHANLASDGGGTSTYGGASVPRWVRVTWREGPGVDMDWKNGGWTGGRVVGDYQVAVRERIPAEAFALVKAARKRVLVLSFRLRDDGVDFGWIVRQQDGVPFRTLMKGGDFLRHSSQHTT